MRIAISVAARLLAGWTELFRPDTIRRLVRA